MAWVERWVVRSSTGKREYIVAKDDKGEFGCSCIGWTSHVPRRDCKHILEVKDGGGRTISQAVMDRMLDR